MFFLILFFILISLLSFSAFKATILNPVNIFSFGFLIGLFALWYSKSLWLVSLSWKTIFLIIGGTLSFILGVVISNIKITMSPSIKKNVVKNTKYEIRTGLKYFSIVTVLLQAVATLLLYKQLRSFSGGSLSAIISYYRNTAMSVNASQVTLSVWLSQLLKGTMSASFIVLFIFLYRKVIQKDKGGYFHLFPIIIYMIQSLLMGGRLQLLRVFVFVFICSYFMEMYTTRNSITANRVILKGTKWVVIVIPFFYLLKGFLGRTSTDNFAQYISRYLGGPIESFDLYLKSGVLGEHKLGQETFTSLYSLFTPNKITTFKWVASPTGVWIGNVFTGFRRYYADFGTVGLLMLSAGLGIFFGFMYFENMNSINKGTLSVFSLVCYGFFSYSLLFEFFDDTFYSVAFSVGMLLQVIEMYFFYRLLFKRSKNNLIEGESE